MDPEQREEAGRQGGLGGGEAEAPVAEDHRHQEDQGGRLAEDQPGWQPPPSPPAAGPGDGRQRQDDQRQHRQGPAERVVRADAPEEGVDQAGGERAEAGHDPSSRRKIVSTTSPGRSGRSRISIRSARAAPSAAPAVIVSSVGAVASASSDWVSITRKVVR